jgi:ABC-type uncharacterized transport system involved in gliding motility auxiliary subunit
MLGKKESEKYIKFLIYLIIVVLVNVAGITLFFRLDLTANKIYSISEASQKVISTLSEPLTIKVFFTKNLPAPHNNTERYIHDLLEEYSIYASRYFNYHFYDVKLKKTKSWQIITEFAPSKFKPLKKMRSNFNGHIWGWCSSTAI